MGLLLPLPMINEYHIFLPRIGQVPPSLILYSIKDDFQVEHLLAYFSELSELASVGKSDTDKRNQRCPFIAFYLTNCEIRNLGLDVIKSHQFCKIRIFCIRRQHFFKTCF